MKDFYNTKCILSFSPIASKRIVLIFNEFSLAKINGMIARIVAKIASIIPPPYIAYSQTRIYISIIITEEHSSEVYHPVRPFALTPIVFIHIYKNFFT